MSSLIFIFLLFLVPHVVLGNARGRKSEEITFDQNYEIKYGGNNIMSLNQGEEIQLSMVYKDLGAGVTSKMTYGSGLFHMRIKVPGRDSAGVVTTFYLISHDNAHDELDFEFLGNRKGKPYTLQTNVYANGVGMREQRFHLWFDPTKDFHDYQILWNQYHAVFYVDNMPIRVYKNNTKIGVSYPSKPMVIEATIWDGSDWATGGGREKINWAYAPFKAHYQGFNVTACQTQTINDPNCASEKYWWNNIKKFGGFNTIQEKQYENIRQKYMTYDYCKDRDKHPTTPLECLHE